MVEQAKMVIANADERERRQVWDMDGPACIASPSGITRKKCSRSPLRARAQQTSETAASAAAVVDADKRLISCSEFHAHSYINPTFISKPNSPRQNWPSAASCALDRSHRSVDRERERLVASGRESNDGTTLIRLLADFIEEFQFDGSGKGETANWVHDSESFPIENRHSYQLAGQLRRLADAFQKENGCLTFCDRSLNNP